MMSKRWLRVLACLICLSTTPAALRAQQIDRLAWLAGTWTEQKDGNVVQEVWLGPRGQMMIGANLATFAGRSSYEFVRIVENSEGMALLASPGGRSPPTVFKLKELGDKRVVFENPTHDFPQRVLYWIDAQGLLNARIEGQAGGRARAIDWRFAKTSP
jgi:hypothetical protein